MLTLQVKESDWPKSLHSVKLVPHRVNVNLAMVQLTLAVENEVLKKLVEKKCEGIERSSREYHLVTYPLGESRAPALTFQVLG